MSETKEELRRQWDWEDREIERLNDQVLELEAENERLRQAIETHRTIFERDSIMPGDRALWEALGDE
jgi:prefoldin subunit 5